MRRRPPQPFRNVEAALAERGAVLSGEIAALERAIQDHRADVAELDAAVPAALDAHGPPEYVFYCGGFGLGVLITAMIGLLVP